MVGITADGRGCTLFTQQFPLEFSLLKACKHRITLKHYNFIGDELFLLKMFSYMANA